MRRRLTVLIFAAAMAVFTAFAGTASAQDDRPVEVWSLPAEVWSSPETASTQRSTADTPEARTYQATSSSATELLRQPPFPPMDISLFVPEVYPDAPPLVPTAEGPADEATLRQQLNSLLVKRFGAGSPRVAEGLAIFDATSTKQIVPDPRLRAVLASLLGTAGEPSIDGTLDGTYDIVRFGTPTNPYHIAEVVYFSDNTVQIIFDDKYQFEDFKLLTSVMAHEPLHRDPTVSNKEELINGAIDTLVHGQVLLENPELATSGTELARILNTSVMAGINSRDTQGDLRLLTSTGNIFPNGAVDIPYFAKGFEPLGSDTPGNIVLRDTLVNVVGPGVTVPANPNFDDATLNLLDLNQNALSDAEVVRLAQILKLNVYKPTVTAFSPKGKTFSRSPVIGATVRDFETNLARSNIRLFVDGKPKAFAYNPSSYRLTLKLRNLRFGKHTVRVVATDAQDKSTSATWSFKVARRR